MAGTESTGVVASTPQNLPAAGRLQTSNTNQPVSGLSQPAAQASTTSMTAMPPVGGFPAPQPTAAASPNLGVVGAAFPGQGARGGPLPVPKRFVPYYDVLRKRRESWSNFPCGLRVLVADNDPASLQVVEKMLKKCDYQVTLCSSGKNSLEILRKRREEFDIVLAEASLPDIDGFKILDVCSKELSLPVVLMSCTGETSAVMRGVMEGARDFLIKPLRQEELKTLWQHVVRYTNELTKTEGNPGGGSTKGESVSLGKSLLDTAQKSNRSTADSDKDSDSSSSKKQRVIWSAEMHQQFVAAVNQLGIDKAVPKRILDLMNIKGLTRENVASHLQKYRLYLKRMANSQDGSVPPMAMEGLVSSESFPSMVSTTSTPQSGSQGVSGGQQQFHYIQQQAPGSQMPSGNSQVLSGGMPMSSQMMQGQLAVGPHHMIQMSNGMFVMPQQMQQAGMMPQEMMQAQASGMTMMSYPMMQVQQQQSGEGVVKSQPMQHQIGPYVNQDGSMVQMQMGDMQQMNSSHEQLVYAHNGQQPQPQQSNWQSGWQHNDM